VPWDDTWCDSALYELNLIDLFSHLFILVHAQSVHLLCRHSIASQIGLYFGKNKTKTQKTLRFLIMKSEGWCYPTGVTVRFAAGMLLQKYIPVSEIWALNMYRDLSANELNFLRGPLMICLSLSPSILRRSTLLSLCSLLQVMLQVCVTHRGQSRATLSFAGIVWWMTSVEETRFGGGKSKVFVICIFNSTYKMIYMQKGQNLTVNTYVAV